MAADTYKKEESLRLYNEIQKIGQKDLTHFSKLSSDQKDKFKHAGLLAQFYAIAPEKRLYDKCYQDYYKKYPKQKENACSRIKLQSTKIDNP